METHSSGHLQVCPVLGYRRGHTCAQEGEENKTNQSEKACCTGREEKKEKKKKKEEEVKANSSSCTHLKQRLGGSYY